VGKSFGKIFLSEMGDRTFVVVALMATKCNQVNLFVVASVALFAFNGFNTWIGVKKPSLFPNLVSNIIVIVFFLAAGVWTLLKGFKNEKVECCSDKCDESETVGREGEHLSEPLLDAEKGTKNCEKGKFSAWKCYAALVLFMCISECGDKTQIAAIKLAAYYNPWAIVLGGGLAIVFGVLVAVIIGRIL